MNFSVNENSKVYYSGKYWNDYPECLSIINTRLFSEDISWTEFLKKQNLVNFKHALILNCGNGWVERELYDNGIILHAVGVEYNQDLVNECNNHKNERNIEYIQHDINTVSFPDNSFDVVINFAACHHIQYIERVCNNIRKWLKPDGLFLHNDYIGPQRNQYAKEEWIKMNEINSLLPIQYKKGLGYPDVQQMMKDDPTEAINSCHIIPTIYKLFDIEYHKKSGGAIAYEILTHNNNLFNLNIEERKKWVQKIMEYDGEYLNKTGNSFFHFIICKNSKSVNQETIDELINDMDKREKLALKLFGHYCYNTLDINETIYTYDHSYGKSFFVHGFHHIEPTGIWSKDNISVIRFRFNNNGNNKLLLSVNSMPNVSQEVTININNNTEILEDIQSKKIIELPLIENKDYPNEAFIIFNYHNVKTPKELHINDDGRKLALLFEWIKLI